jgi:hypothetical protein
MATAEEIRDIMRDEYPHLTPTIPEIGRVVKFITFDPKSVYVTLDILEDTLEYTRHVDQLTVNYKLAMIGDSTVWQLSFALNDTKKVDSSYSWEYVDST